MARYLSCGNIMSDVVEFADGTRGPFHLGGPAIFGLEGIRLWTDDCAMVCHAGEDWQEGYGDWLDRNGIEGSTVGVLPGETSRCLIGHRADGSYKWVPLQGEAHIRQFDLTADLMLSAIGPETSGVYLYMYPGDPFFKELHTMRQKSDFQLMWELGADRMPARLDLLRDLQQVDMFSLNSLEAARIFDIPRRREEEIITRLQQLPVSFIFYRVGKRGAYGITADEVWFCPAVDPAGPSVDPSGCGNCSTAAAMYGWAAGLGPAGAAVTACISSGYNAAQFGVWPQFTARDRQRAQDLYRQMMAQQVVRCR